MYSFLLFIYLCFPMFEAYSVGLFSERFPVVEISDNENFYKRTVSQMGGNSEMPNGLLDPLHGVKMGISSDICDNAKDNLKIDWDGSPVNYTCYHPKNPLPILKDLKPTVECEVLKKHYPKHICMNEKIEYATSIPTHGNHRPLWPVYGEYEFVPPQRWLHNLEHGAIVMLYHPCTEPLEVDRLRKIVKSCIRKYIISPTNMLPVEKPLVLVAWGCKLQMNHVNEELVVNFIKEHALHGPEGKLAKQGQYRYKLLEISVTPTGSDYKDSNLCPTAK